MIRPLPLFLVVLALPPALSAAPELSSAGFAKTVTPLFEEHCYGCHGDGEKKGGLALDKLGLDFSTPQKLKTWVKVFDKLETGEMPPKKKARPPQAATAAATQWLNAALLAADTKHVADEGRAMLRRLTRTEYENTVRDLLGVDTALRDVLPEDASTEGFDKVDEGLRLSPVLIECYLEAAHRALDAAIETGPKPVTKTVKLSYLTKDGEMKKRLGKSVLGRADDVVFFDNERGSEAASMRSIFRAPTTGRYRVRVSACGFQKAGLTTMHVAAKTFNPANGQAKLSGFFDVPQDQPTVVEVTGFLPINATVSVSGYNLGERPVNGVANYKGPGLAVQWVEVEGPLAEVWPPASHTRLFGPLDFKNATLADAEKVLRDFLPRAFRRPIAPDEIAPYLALVKAKLEAKASFEEAIRTGLVGVLCSPDFLFLREVPGRLDGPALASRLSYFLCNSMPDDELLAVAAKGQLTQPAVLRAQTERLLNDPKAARFVTSFTGQWLELDNLDATLPDKLLYPEHDSLLQNSMGREVRDFFTELLRANLPVENFLSSDFSMLNGRLARHYDIPGVEGQEFRKVQLPPGSHRGGLITMAAILKVTANGTSTSPVVRGKFVLDRVLGRPPDPPPADVPAIEPDTRGAKTLRELLVKHRESVTCAGCHAKIDPPGFALESFDVIGGFREKYRTLPPSAVGKSNAQNHEVKFIYGLKVDSKGEMEDGRKFTQIDEFKKLLLADRDHFTKALAGRLLLYGTGHAVEFSDRPAIAQIAARTIQQGRGLRTLLHEVIQSPSFTTK